MSDLSFTLRRVDPGYAVLTSPQLPGLFVSAERPSELAHELAVSLRTYSELLELAGLAGNAATAQPEYQMMLSNEQGPFSGQQHGAFPGWHIGSQEERRSFSGKAGSLSLIDLQAQLLTLAERLEAENFRGFVLVDPTNNRTLAVDDISWAISPLYR